MAANPLFNNAAIAAHLENLAKNGGVTTYGAIVEQFGLPLLDGAWSAHPLSEIFELFDQQDAAANRPFRTSVVIAQELNRPGDGFFEALERLKNVPDPRTPNARDALWTAEITAAHNYPWP